MKIESGESTLSRPTLGSKYKYQMLNEVIKDNTVPGGKVEVVLAINCPHMRLEITTRAKKLTPG